MVLFVRINSSTVMTVYGIRDGFGLVVKEYPIVKISRGTDTAWRTLFVVQSHVKSSTEKVRLVKDRDAIRVSFSLCCHRCCLHPLR